MAPACHVAALLGYTGIRSHAVTCNSMGVPKHLSKPGQHLRTRRLSLGLTLRDVHVASLSLARELRKPAFVIPPSRLHDIEMKKMTPSIHRLYTLARVYRCRLNELLWWYGIPPR
jgi:transcriptional regulator with XRE-family HTH domain